MEKISLSQMGEEGQIFSSELTYQSPNGLIITTHCIFLGLKFLVRNEEKDEIPCQGMRKIQGIFLPIFLCNLSKRWIKKGAQNFPKKSPYSWNTIFNPSYNFYCIFMH